MHPDHIALLAVTSMAKSIGSSALPNAPVVDDSNDRPPMRVRLAALRSRVSRLFETEPCFDGSQQRPCPATS